MSDQKKFKWYIAFVNPKEEESMAKKVRTICEKKFQEEYQNLIGEMYVPKSRFKVVKNGEMKEVERLAYPGYLFIQLNMSPVVKMALLSIDGLRSFLSNERGEPQAMTEKEYQDAIKSVETISNKNENIHSYHVGDRVVVKEGSFQEFEGMIFMVNSEDKVLDIKVSFFGKETDVMGIPFTSVQKIIAEE